MRFTKQNWARKTMIRYHYIIYVERFKRFGRQKKKFNKHMNFNQITKTRTSNL